MAWKLMETLARRASVGDSAWETLQLQPLHFPSPAKRQSLSNIKEEHHEARHAYAHAHAHASTALWVVHNPGQERENIPEYLHLPKYPERTSSAEEAVCSLAAIRELHFPGPNTAGQPHAS